MIEGLKIRMSSSELKSHCQARANYHATRAQEKAEHLPEIKKSLESIRGHASPTNVANMVKSGYHLADDPVKELERDITEHQNKSLVFTFFSEHLFDEDYTLKEDDLIRLEILKGRL